MLLTPGIASAQTPGLFDVTSSSLHSPGWAGFRDVHFMLTSLGALLLATALGAVIAYHPTAPRTIDHLHEAEMPKVYIMYAFIGAVIGVCVREFGMVIGLVVFGIGGLIRFRTDTDSTRETSRLITVTLAGLIAGLGLPHFAVITTAFGFVLVYVFDSQPAYRVRIEQLPPARLGDCAEVYREVLKRHGCRILTEHKVFGKDRVEFVFRLPRGRSRHHVHAALNEAPEDLRGQVDWEVR
jgi:hypothetical protein